MGKDNFIFKFDNKKDEKGRIVETRFANICYNLPLKEDLSLDTQRLKEMNEDVTSIFENASKECSIPSEEQRENAKFLMNMHYEKYILDQYPIKSIFDEIDRLENIMKKSIRDLRELTKEIIIKVKKNEV